MLAARSPDEMTPGLDRTEALFQAAFDAAPDGIVVFDDAGAYLYVNSAAASLYSLAPEALAGRTIGDFTGSGDRGQIDAWWDALRQHGQLEGRHRIVTADGSERVLAFRTRADFLPGRHVTVIRAQPTARVRLSPREQEVMQLLARGLNGSSIASALSISPETVRTHVRNAMDKLGARTRPHAIALAAAHGEITVET